MQDARIPDFIGASPVNVTVLDIGQRLVAICQRAGSSSFQHAMTADQAEELADALRIKAAEVRGHRVPVLDPALVALVQSDVPSFISEAHP